MKKSIITIITSVVVSLLLLTAIGFGLWQYYSNHATKTGNKLDVTWYNETDKEFYIRSQRQRKHELEEANLK